MKPVTHASNSVGISRHASHEKAATVNAAAISMQKKVVSFLEKSFFGEGVFFVMGVPPF